MLIVIETSDVVFAVDSIPAILAVSREQFIVFSSNAFAILGLRALYFLLADLRDRFRYLQQGLAVILAFVGIKMIIAEWYHIDTFVSLGVIAVVLAVSIWLSMRKDALEQAAEAQDAGPGVRRLATRPTTTAADRPGAGADAPADGDSEARRPELTALTGSSSDTDRKARIGHSHLAPARARSDHHSSSSSSPSAFSQPNCTSVPRRHRSSWRSHQSAVATPWRSSDGAEAFDGGLLGFREARPVDRQVPAEVVTSRALARVGAVDQDGAAVGVAAEVAHLPVAVEERRGRGGDGLG